MAKSRRAASGEPVGAGAVCRLDAVDSGSGGGMLRKVRASSATSLKSTRPQLSRMTSRRSPCSPVAASVHLPAKPLGESLSRTYIERPGVLRTSQIGRAHVELQSLMRISYAVFCLKKKKASFTDV